MRENARIKYRHLDLIRAFTPVPERDFIPPVYSGSDFGEVAAEAFADTGNLPGYINEMADKIIKLNIYLSDAINEATELAADGYKARETLEYSIKSIRLPEEIACCIDGIDGIGMDNDGNVKAKIAGRGTRELFIKGGLDLREGQVSADVHIKYRVEDLYEENQDVFGEMQKCCERMESVKNRTGELVHMVNRDVRSALQDALRLYVTEIVVDYHNFLRDDRKRIKPKLRNLTLCTCRTVLYAAATYCNPQIKKFDYPAELYKFGNNIASAQKKRETPEPGPDNTAIEATMKEPEARKPVGAAEQTQPSNGT